jgi:ribose 5-phosphate isomerase A
MCLSSVAPTLSQTEHAIPKVRHLKKECSEAAVDEYVHSHSVVGLGTGSTVQFALHHLAELLKVGALDDVSVVPCSEKMKKRCISLGIPVSNLNEHPHVDVIIDGADEVDMNLSAIKGGSGAFLREKMVSGQAEKRILVVDDTKLVKNLGPGRPLPVEVIPYSAENTRRMLESELPELSGCRALLRRGSVTSPEADGFGPAVTDNGNYVVDLYFDKPIQNVPGAAAALDRLPGVVAHGLFCNTDDAHTTVIVASDRGVRVAGEGGEKPWWEEQQTRVPIARSSVDNRRPQGSDG